ncbi:MAG: GWxTD domain-containing protein [Bacteroidales bacterium]|nr:GWxTD domain-containing protein [Bacteroidales bacterium]
MKKTILFLSLAALLATAQAQPRMQALFGYSTFWLADRQSPYVETYLSFDAWTMQFERQPDGVYRATAEVVLLLKQGDSVCFLRKYDLNSPTVASLDELDFTFLDLQRFPMRNGIYDLELSVRDKLADAEPSVVAEKLVINYDAQHPSLSSIQLIASATPTERENNLSRGGYDMEPYVSDFLPESVDQLNFYYEIYNIDRETGRKPFLALAFVEQQETGSRFEGQQLARRKYSEKVVPVYGSLDISHLPSGNYNLVVELRNAENQLMLYKKLPFFRSNPGVKGVEISDFATTFAGRYTDEQQLALYIDALYPLASEHEKDAARDLISRPGLEEKQAFLYRFWTKRDPVAPEAAWLKYKERVDYVQAQFSYPRTPGIHTDRGRVYLQYGPPDFIRDEKNYVSARYLNAAHSNTRGITVGESGGGGEDPSASESQGHVYYLPYQLWRYNKLATDDPNRVFLFWDEHRSGFYKLLNSNARGEVQEAGWERRLCRQQLPENMVGAVGEQFNRGY